MKRYPSSVLSQTHPPSLNSLVRLVLGRLAVPHGLTDVIWNLFHSGLIILNMQEKSLIHLYSLLQQQFELR